MTFGTKGIKLLYIALRSSQVKAKYFLEAATTSTFYQRRWISPRTPHTSQWTLALFKSFLLGSQDLKVNLCGLQQDIHSDGKSKKIVGIAWQFPHYSYTVGPYGKGPTGDYTTCTYSN